MKIRYLWLSVVAVFLFFYGCVSDGDGVAALSEDEKSVSEERSEGIIPGQARILVSENLAAKIDASVSAGTLPEELSEAVPGIISVRRSVPPSERFEVRHREAGLNLWYDVVFDSATPVTRASSELKGSVAGVISVEPKVRIRKMSAGFPFCDPYAARQWHYFNEGSAKSSLPGCDINVRDAWKSYKSGDRSVIVAVVDGGVDCSHEDLADNMWVNGAEASGTPGVDDDGNGYKDDIYGFNFVLDVADIHPDEHGTHVAGTVAAVNNNGKGVCGVAGGDGSGNGIRLMSCAIFDGDASAGNASILEAMVYAADNGAVICQNSWGYDDKSSVIYQSDRKAIDYFTKYAGYDENGIQTGPMAGGIVIFAAGNDGIDVASPAMYDSCLSVAAVTSAYTMAYYSNYGSWVDISAPGGSGYSDEEEIYSTLPGNQYGYLAGTSMACPHVSGVAALIVSNYGGAGFTNKMLWERLTSSATPLDAYNYKYTGMMGSGLVNAMAALAPEGSLPPPAVAEIEGAVSSNKVTLRWDVPSAAGGGAAAGYYVYYSTSSLEGVGSEQLRESVKFLSFLADDVREGGSASVSFYLPAFETDYFLSVVSYGRDGSLSSPSQQFKVRTSSDSAPVITPLDGTSVSLNVCDSVTLRFAISDPDGHSTSWTLNPSDNGCRAYVEGTGSIVTLLIRGFYAGEGSHKATLKVTDLYGLSTKVEVTYKINPNNPPVAVKEMDNMIIDNPGGERTLRLSDYFSDPDGETPVYSVVYDNEEVVAAVVEEGVLNISALGYGMASLAITATDCLGEKVSSSFKILVRNPDNPVEIYPNPVSDKLYIRTGEDCSDVSIAITGVSGSAVYSVSGLSVSPFDPVSVDVSGFGAGVYAVTINYGDGRTLKKGIVKI